MKRLAIILIDGFADWEGALLSASAREHFGADVRYFSPGGRSVASIGGLSVLPNGPIEEMGIGDFDALLAIGSGEWMRPEPRSAVAPLLAAAHAAGRVVRGICGATLALAEAGLLDTRPHTSNARAFLIDFVAGYRGAEHYLDQPRAVAADRVVSAAGSAPASFAIETAKLLWPEKVKEIADLNALFSAEHAAPRR